MVYVLGGPDPRRDPGRRFLAEVAAGTGRAYVLETALGLIESTNIRGRDAVHAATAPACGIETIASSDPAFDGIPSIRRLDPLKS